MVGSDPSPRVDKDLETTPESTLCEICGAQFPNERLLHDHREGLHGSRCPVCDSEFSTEAMLDEHRRTHENPTAPQREERLAELSETQGERKP